MGRSKVVRKFLYRNFLPPEVQKGRYPCAASRPRCADTCSPFLSICRANAISCALPREMLKNADYTTFSTDRNRPAFAGRFFMSVERYPVGCDDSAHRCLPPARIIPQGRTLFARAREMDANKQHLPAEGNGAPRSYPRAPSLAALPQFTLSRPAEVFALSLCAAAWYNQHRLERRCSRRLKPWQDSCSNSGSTAKTVVYYI